jgi:hypothetical protein
MNREDLKKEISAYIDENISEEGGEVDLAEVEEQLEAFVASLTEVEDEDEDDGDIPGTGEDEGETVKEA